MRFGHFANKGDGILLKTFQKESVCFGNHPENIPMWPQRHISEVIESHNDRKTIPQICVYTKKSINSSEQRRTQPWIELVVRYLLDSVHSIRVMNDGIYEAQTRPIILQHNNNIQCSPSGPKAAAAKKKKKKTFVTFCSFQLLLVHNPVLSTSPWELSSLASISLTGK